MCKNPGEQEQQGGYCGSEEVCFGGDSTKYGEPEWNKAALCSKVLCYCEHQNNEDSGMNGIICKNLKTGVFEEKSYCSSDEKCWGTNDIATGVKQDYKATLCKKI